MLIRLQAGVIKNTSCSRAGISVYDVGTNRPNTLRCTAEETCTGDLFSISSFEINDTGMEGTVEGCEFAGG